MYENMILMIRFSLTKIKKICQYFPYFGQYFETLQHFSLIVSSPSSISAFKPLLYYVTLNTGMLCGRWILSLGHYTKEQFFNYFHKVTFQMHLSLLDDLFEKLKNYGLYNQIGSPDFTLPLLPNDLARSLYTLMHSLSISISL